MSTRADKIVSEYLSKCNYDFHAAYSLLSGYIRFFLHKEDDSDYLEAKKILEHNIFIRSMNEHSYHLNAYGTWEKADLSEGLRESSSPQKIPWYKQIWTKKQCEGR